LDHRAEAKKQRQTHHYLHGGGLAPVTLFVGTRDILFSDCLNYHEYEAMLHDWMLISLPESKQVLREIVAILGTNRS
jgi:hypothetical protein